MMPKFLLIFAFLTILLISITPTIAATTETLEITDLSNVKYDFTYQQLTEMPKTNVYAELYCYGNMVTLGELEWSTAELSTPTNKRQLQCKLNPTRRCRLL